MQENINTRLYKLTKPYQTDYDCSNGLVRSLLLFPDRKFAKRQEDTEYAIKAIMIPNGKEGLREQIAALAHMEKNIRGIAPRHRDHVVHAFLSFAFGIYLNHEFLRLPLTTLQWKISALFHDIAYPAEVAATNFLISMQKKVNDIKKQGQIKNRPDVVFQVKPMNLDILENGNSFGLIQACIEKWELEIDARGEFDSFAKSGKVCHGMLSALVVLYVIDILYESHNSCADGNGYPFSKCGEGYINWDRKHFIQEIVPACSAIFIHNLDKKHFVRKKIGKESAPLAFLLKLADTLQEWDRPSQKKPKGYASKGFGIKVEDGSLLFGVPKPLISKIKEDIASFFFETDVQGIKIIPMRPDFHE